RRRFHGRDGRRVPGVVEPRAAADQDDQRGDRGVNGLVRDGEPIQDLVVDLLLAPAVRWHGRPTLGPSVPQMPSARTTYGSKAWRTIIVQADLVRNERAPGLVTLILPGRRD